MRTGFDSALVAHLHATAVYVTIAATARRVSWSAARAAVLLLAVEVLQAAIGLTQYHLGLPIGLVPLHLLGAALGIAAATNLCSRCGLCPAGSRSHFAARPGEWSWERQRSCGASRRRTPAVACSARMDSVAFGAARSAGQRPVRPPIDRLRGPAGG